MRTQSKSLLSTCLLAGGLLALAFACVSKSREVRDTPPNAWWEGHGPVVPHDSFPGDCSLCHEASGWSEIRTDFVFDHEKETGVALEGAHAAAECLRCHNDRGPVKTFAARGCSGCHEDIHRGELGRSCDICHNQVDWSPEDRVLGHEGTRFPLVGAHASVACWRCHPGANTGDFVGEDPACESCHAKNYQSTTNPDHVAAGFPMNCEQCHIPTSWSGAAFRHPGFALTAGHAGLNCSDCHTSPSFSQQTTQCSSCHLDDYQTTTNPNHTASGFPTTCESCHTTTTWLGATFNHTNWPLTGSHLGLNCSDCHIGGIFTGTSTDCFSCHATEYQNTTNPDHAASGFPTTCENCHSTLSWSGATFNHSQWPLTGAHVGIDCLECHIGGVFSGTSSDCFSCHAAEYQNTTNPDHAAAGFPTTCETCHSTLSWAGATFNHSQWPLTGAHVGIDCLECHIGGVFSGTSSDCFSCHATEYQNTTNPDHAAAGFPTTCEVCHTTTTWQGASFSHPQFPITSGKHKKLDCADCHTTPGNFQTFSCIDCHEHRQSKMDSKHKGVSGYVWQSSACYACHPNGKE